MVVCKPVLVCKCVISMHVLVVFKTVLVCKYVICMQVLVIGKPMLVCKCVISIHVLVVCKAVKPKTKKQRCLVALYLSFFGQWEDFMHMHCYNTL